MSNAIADKSLDFAVRIVNLYKCLLERHEVVMSKQILRSGTSIGVNVREANSAQSKSDFISKTGIALKECDETGYWLELLVRTAYISQEEYKSVEADRREVFAIITAILKTAKANVQR